MAVAVLTPFGRHAAVELGNRLWRKRLLPVGDVEYKGRTLHFTRDYLASLAAAFSGKAYDQVPFQLADAGNAHTNDPERTRGWVTGMDLADDGLWITAELTPDGEKVLRSNPGLGVSARIVEEYARSDGKFYPAAVQHVLGTLDPRIPGLGAWQAIEAANDTEQVIDLSALHFTGEETDMPDGLTEDERARLARLLAIDPGQLEALASGTVITAEDLAAMAAADDDAALAAEIEAMSDEEFAALVGEYEADTAPVPAGLSGEAQFSIDLANARADEAAREVTVITRRLEAQDFAAERRRLADAGVPPYVTDLAMPLLKGTGKVIEFAGDDGALRQADAGQVMRKVLTEFARIAGLGDMLGAELGSPMDEPAEAADRARASTRDEIVSRARAQMFGITG